MALLIIGLILFLGIHSVSIFAQDSRDRLAAKNTLMWKGFYSIVSIVGIILIAKGYAALRFDPVILYSSPYWLRHITYLGMLFAMVLFVAPYFPGRIGRITKHPQLLAVKIWAICHLLVNGTLADVILFTSFLIWAVLDIISMKKREKRAIPSLPESGFNDVIAIIIGIALTVSFVMFLHGKLIGMPLIG